MATSKNKCTGCKKRFPIEIDWIKKGPIRFHSAECLIDYSNSKKKRQWRKEKNEYRKSDKSYRFKQAQSAFNAYIRERDGDLPCISCQRYHQGQYHAGHYRTVGAAPELRFEELNCHKQCAPCNNHLSGNIAEYRIGLIKKIGLDKVEWIEGPHEAKKYTVDDLLKIERRYKQKLKDLVELRKINDISEK